MVGLKDENWDDLKGSFIEKKVLDYSLPLVEDPKNKKDSFLDDNLPFNFKITEKRMNEIITRKDKTKIKQVESDEEDEEEEQVDQTTLLQNLISNLRGEEEEEEEEDFYINHDYLSDDSDEDNIPNIEYDMKQYGSIRSDRIIASMKQENYSEVTYWNTSKMDFDVEEIMEAL
jgi:hypothetical protein